MTRPPWCGGGPDNLDPLVQSTAQSRQNVSDFLDDKLKSNLGIVQTMAVRLPGVDEAIGYGIPLGIEDLALDPHIIAFAF